MPYFKWTGIDLSGKTRHGKRYAQSRENLDTILFKKDIALLSCAPTKPIWLSRISVSTQLQFFNQLATLLRAGILLPQALTILADQIAQAQLQPIVHELADDVQAGIPIHTACAKHPQTFNYLMIQTIKVGNNAGNLPAALDLLAHHLETIETFRKKVRSAAMLPALTLIFFCVVALFLFTIVVPRFADLFANAKQQLPPLTHAMIQISNYIRSWNALIGFGAFCIGLFIFKKWRTSASGSLFCDSLLLRLPYINNILIHTQLVTFLKSLAMLLQSGMQIVPALHIAQNTVHNQLLSNEIKQLEQDVHAGSSLSQAMENHDSILFHQDTISLIRVGEESGSLSQVLIAASEVSHQKVERSLNFLTTIMQPLLIIFLGVLIAALIFAIYLPIFNLANIV